MSKTNYRLRRRMKSQRGVTLFEVLVVLAVLSLGLLSHAATTLAGSKLMRTERRHGIALQTLREFKARLRSDVTWDGLYADLSASMGTAPGSAQPVSTYFPDMDLPAELGEVTVFVEVPRTAPSSGAPGLVLREDVTNERFGLPYDLNGDGVIDDEPRDSDYLALPVILTLEWVGPGDAPQKIQVTTWLRGERG